MSEQVPEQPDWDAIIHDIQSGAVEPVVQQQDEEIIHSADCVDFASPLDRIRLQTDLSTNSEVVGPGTHPENSDEASEGKK